MGSRFTRHTVSSRFVGTSHERSKTRTSRSTALTFRHRVSYITASLYARGAKTSYSGAPYLCILSTELPSRHASGPSNFEVAPRCMKISAPCLILHKLRLLSERTTNLLLMSRPTSNFRMHVPSLRFSTSST
jgi:hypothetical protein